MTKEQIAIFYNRKIELELIELECNSKLKYVSTETAKNRLSCDGKMPDGSIARGYDNNHYLCQICHCSHDFDSMEIKTYEK